MQSLFEKIWASHVVVPETRRHAGGLVRRLAPVARGHDAAGVRLAARRRAAGTAPRSLPRDARSLDADRARQDAEGSRDRQRAFGREAGAADGEATARISASSCAASRAATAASCTSWAPSSARRSPARRSSAATRTRARTARSAPSPSASARRRSATCSRRSACCSASRRRSRSISRGKLPADVTAKDLILKIIGTIGVGGGTGHVIEYRGGAIGAPVDGRAHDGLQHVDRGRRARRA